MAHHKRGKCKNARAGCLMCKPHKANGVKGGKEGQTRQELQARLSYNEYIDFLDAPESDAVILVEVKPEPGLEDPRLVAELRELAQKLPG
jgi:hypothetical protein